MAVTIAALHTRIESIVSAIDDGDYAEAKKQLAAADAILLGIPNSNEGDAGYSFRQQIDGLRKTLNELGATAAGSTTLGMQRQRYQFAEPTEAV
jgi:hypothetical protein